MDDNTLTVRDHSKPCDHLDRAYELPDAYQKRSGVWSCSDPDCPGGREIVFEQWGDWCWAHDREVHGPFGDACLMQGYRGDCDIRPMYELVEVEHE